MEVKVMMMMRRRRRRGNCVVGAESWC